MCTQTSGITFSDHEIQKIVIEDVFDERKQYLIIALTGKIGAGSSYVSSFIKESYRSRDISRDTPGLDGFSSDLQRANSILLRYFNCNRIPFHVIRVRDVITSFILEDDAWERLDTVQDNSKTIQSTIMKSFCPKIEKLLASIHTLNLDKKDAALIGVESVSVAEAESLKKLVQKLLSIGSDPTDCSKLVSALTALNNELKNRDSVNIEKVDIRNYILYILPLLADCIRGYVAKNYTLLFQQFGNDLRFYGTLKADESERLKVPLKKNNLYTIAERINRMIKHIRAGAQTDKRTAIVIDSMKNKYESNYLRDRYSAYYLFAVSRDETIRIQRLLQDQKKGLSQDELGIIDLNERPEAVAGRFICFVESLRDADIEGIKAASIVDASKNFDTDEFKNYLSMLCQSTCDNFYHRYCVPFQSKTQSREKSPGQIMLKDLQESSLISAIHKIVFEPDGQISQKFREQGISSVLCNYYLSVLADPLRAFFI